MSMVPVLVLMKGILKPASPAPDLVTVPALVKVVFPKNVFTACTSKVPPSRLFSVPPRMNPPLQTMVPELLIVPFWKDLSNTLLILIKSPDAIVVVPVVYSEPRLNSRESSTEMSADPLSVPLLNRRYGGGVSVEFNVTLLPDMTTLSVALTGPLNV